MKRIVCMLLVSALLLSLVGCGSKRMSGISDDAYDLGLAALETTDDFISGKIDAETARDNLESAIILVDGCDGENDSLISTSIFFIQYAISRKGSGIGTMNEVEEKRDQLADYLGK